MAPEIINLLQEQSFGATIELLEQNIVTVTKLNWDYLDALKFQEWANDFVWKNKNISIIIFTNHPTCLTLGRGLQRKIGVTSALIDFDPQIKERLTIPVYSIKRGGGLTFHHPGQLVIYPIINLTTYDLKVYGLMSQLFKMTTEVLKEELHLDEFDYCRDLLGLWKEQTKYASIGLQVRRFVTFHGLALNLFANESLKRNLPLIFPCGLPPQTYGNIQDLHLNNFSIEEIIIPYKCKLPLLLQ